jgi:hypothetical protein
MNAVILVPAMAAVVITGAGFLAVLVMLPIGMRAEGKRIRQSSTGRICTRNAARLILGVYVRDEHQELSGQYDDVRS